jgi:hypothetical protein
MMNVGTWVEHVIPYAFCSVCVSSKGWGRRVLHGLAWMKVRWVKHAIPSIHFAVFVGIEGWERRLNMG